MTTHDPVVIVGTARTPMGGFQGDARAADRAAARRAAIAAALERAGLKPEDVERGLHGLRAAGRPGPGARRARRRSAPGCPVRPAHHVNKMCGSGMKAAMMAHDAASAPAPPTSWSPAAWRA